MADADLPDPSRMSDVELDRFEVDSARWKSGDEAYCAWCCAVMDEVVRRGIEDYGHA